MTDRHRACVCQCPLWQAVVLLATLVLAGRAFCTRAHAQLFSQIPAELAETIRVDEPPPAVRAQMERVRVHVGERQWDEAIEGLREVMENHGQRLVRLDTRFIPLREIAHRQLAALPSEALAIYRGRVDLQAERWYSEGVKHRDTARLSRVVGELFTSSYGDNALLALGDIALERGEFQTAREYWEQISSELRDGEGLPVWVAQRSANASAGDRSVAKDESKLPDEGPSQSPWLAYPDTDLQLADVRARLVLASILEGALNRAAVEYRDFVDLHGDATGRLAGVAGPYRETLAELLRAAKNWPAPHHPAVATTFAGDASRNFIAPVDFKLRSLAWDDPVSLAPVPAPPLDISNRFRLPALRVAESAQGLLSYHPLFVGDLVVFHDRDRIYVYNLKTGRPAWESGDSSARPGQVYPRGKVREREGHAAYLQALGVPRFTPTVHGSYLFVRLGPQVTSWPETNITERPGSLIVLDLAQQAKLIAEIKPENERWSFEGPPVCEGSRCYVAMRYNDVRPQAHVACYEIAATTGAAGTIYTPRLRWRRMICAAESPARGSIEEITHNLLTLAEGALYINTNLGAVARLAAEDGEIRWLATYPRAKGGQNNAHWFRDLNPCLYYRGTVFVAPTDSPRIFAFDAMTGLVRWASAPALADVVHLLGVAEGSLIASGKQIWWLDAETGKAVISFPARMEINQAKPFGRGVLAGDVVVWPTRDELHVFFQRQTPSSDANARPAAPRDPIRLADYANGISGGNLAVAGDYILLATPEKLWAFGPKLSDNPVTQAH